MTFEMFENEVLKHLQKKIGKDADVSIEHIRKNNNEILSGLQIRKPESVATPVLYLEEYYRGFRICGDFDYIIDKILRDYDMACRSMPKELKYGQINYDYVKDRIIYRLVNYDKNKEILQDCPYIRLYDLAVSFRWIAYTDETGVGSALITNREMDLWKIDTQDLILAAQKNTPRLFPPKMIPMDELLHEEEIIYDKKENIDMYICTNEMQLNGASVILYDNFLQNFAKKHQTDYYILPASIHEMILVPADEYSDVPTLADIVSEANQTIVALGEILSESVYCYRWREEKLELVM